MPTTVKDSAVSPGGIITQATLREWPRQFWALMRGFGVKMLQNDCLSLDSGHGSGIFRLKTLQGSCF